MKLLSVALGGAAGAILRYGVQVLLPRSSSGVPWSTYLGLTNLIGLMLVFAGYSLAKALYS